ncbi:MAG TPA: hypothetical protein PKC58_15285 [Ignavibacteria bacterium]|nr:hypothetical protein [Ignavibacteria bacterium]
MKQKFQIHILIFAFFLIGCQTAYSQPTLSQVLQKGTYQSIEGEFEEFIDGQISNTYEGNFDLVVYEDNGKMFCALLPKFIAEAAYIKEDVRAFRHSEAVFFVLKKSSGTANCKSELEVKTYLVAGNSLNKVWRVNVNLDFCYEGKGYSVNHKSWE